MCASYANATYRCTDDESYVLRLLNARLWFLRVNKFFLKMLNNDLNETAPVADHCQRLTTIIDFVCEELRTFLQAHRDHLNEQEHKAKFIHP